MRKPLLFLVAGAVLAAGGWAALALCGKDRLRARALQVMPVMYESVVDGLEHDEKGFVAPMDDSYDPGLVEWAMDEYHTEDFIPERLRAYSEGAAALEPQRLKATIRVGDRVEVLAEKVNNAGRMVFLVRTAEGTYCWLYGDYLGMEEE